MDKRYKVKSQVQERLIDCCPLCGKQKRSDATVSAVLTDWFTTQSICKCSNAAKESKIELLYEKNREAIDNVSTKGANEPRPDLGENYEILDDLGHGGMASVYRVFDRVLRQEFAVKVMKESVASDKQMVKRFKLEAKAVESLEHTNLIPVFGQGKTKTGLPFFVMGLSNGTTLREELKACQRFDMTRSLDIAEQVAEALKHAHSLEVVHRDIKPSNILIEKGASGTETAKVVDFGIAKVAPIENKVGQGLTMTGEFFGTPAYMSPEHCLGKIVDERSDVYSLGCVLYEMLTGSPPFVSDNPIKTIVSHINSSPEPISSQLGLDKDLCSMVMKALTKEPDQRYQSMEEVLSDIRDLKSGKKLKIKEVKEKSPSSDFQDLAVVVVVLFVMLLLIAAPVYYFFSIAHKESSSQIAVPRPQFVIKDPASQALNDKRALVQLPQAGGAAGKFVFHIENEFGEVLFTGHGNDHREASRNAITEAIKQKVSFIGVALKDVDFSSLDLSGADFSKARFFNVDFNKAKLANVNFLQSSLEHCSFNNANCSGTNFAYAKFQKVRAVGANFSNSIFLNSSLSTVEAPRANFEGADFEHASFSDCTGVDMTFKDAKLVNASINTTNFKNSKFQSADFSNALVRASDFSNSDFSNSVFAKVYFNKVVFKNARFNGALFRDGSGYPRDRSSIFYSSDISGASFSEVDDKTIW